VIPTPTLLPHLLKFNLAREQSVKQTQLTFSGGANLCIHGKKKIIKKFYMHKILLVSVYYLFLVLCCIRSVSAANTAQWSDSAMIHV